MRALLFADDIILIAPTVQGLIKSIDNFSRWCSLNELQVGLSKCAAMGISGDDDISTAHDLLKTAKDLLVIGQDPAGRNMLVPILDEYKYLGTFIHFSFSPQLTLSKQANLKTCPSLFSIAPLLRNQGVPIKARSSMLLQFIRPSLTHANILWAMRDPQNLSPIEISTQKFLSLGLSFILGKSIKYKTDTTLHEHNVALLELGILDVQTYATQEKIRFMSKYFNDPKVCSKSTYGLILSAGKVSPTPGTISSDYL
jgi:hypothetical protein